MFKKLSDKTNWYDLVFMALILESKGSYIGQADATGLSCTR